MFGRSRFLNGGIWMRRGCIFYRACNERGRGSNCCRMYTLSLLLNPVPQDLQNKLLPPPTHSFTWRDSNGDPRGEPAGYGLQQGVPLCVRRLVLLLHQVECDVQQRSRLRGWPRRDHHWPLIRQRERRRPEHVGGTSESSLHNLCGQGHIHMQWQVHADLGHEGVSASRNWRVHG